MSDRLDLLKQWLVGLDLGAFEISLVSGDASFRKYYRVSYQGKHSIAMDAPPDKEDCAPFVHVDKAFSALGLHVPEILAVDLPQGFMLLSDLGDVQYAHVLNSETVDRYYGDALDVLLKLQCGDKPEGVDFPPYDHALLMREMQLFPEWFLQKHLGIAFDATQREQWTDVCEVLAQSALEQPQVWVHRDYHSRNLMVVEENNPGIIDFQDAVVGAMSYDPASLLRDCYVAWPAEKVYGWLEGYRQQLLQRADFDVPSQATLQRWFDLMGSQRHLKAIGIFARLNHRDGKPGYLADIPRTLHYVRQVSEKYENLRFLYQLIEQDVLPRLDSETGMPK